MKELSEVLTVIVLMSLGVCDSTIKSRIVRVKQGKLQGIVQFPGNPTLDPVECYLGIPYAGAPVGKLRFMPPSTPQSWPQNTVKKVEDFAPVCPQIVPDLTNEREALRYMTPGRLKYLRKLFKFLQKNQSEDCLYLNVYTPHKTGTMSQNLPVIVFIHGESYEWNSGNPYDGSVLSSYGQAVIVTLNYRLGFFGFLKTEESKMGNFGLLDIFAALLWIKENISQFGGDSSNVTLMGQGTGAALTSLLLLSPVAQRTPLFKRAILMSGSSLAKSAIVRNPEDITRQVAAETQCPMQSGLFAECLREKDVRTILNLQIKTPAYSTPIGPYVDGHFIPKLPEDLVQDYVPSYDLMFGVTGSESFHLFPSFTVNNGLSHSDKSDILRTMIRTEFATYGQNLEQVIQTIENEYRDIYQTREDKMTNLHVLLEIFSDARIVAPLLKSAELLTNNQKASYLYLFNHTTTKGYFPPDYGSVHGEELPYVFGMPLVGGTFHLMQNYTEEEKILSFEMMTYWVNFARTGVPGKSAGKYGGRSVYWQQFDPVAKQYIILDEQLKMSHHYKPQKMAVWNKIIPDLVEGLRGAVVPGKPTEEDPSKNIVIVGGGTEVVDVGSGNNSISAPDNQIQKKSDGMFSEKNLPVSLIVIIGLLLLLLNLSACSGVYYQRQRVRRREENLERKIKRLSDAGFRHEELSENGPSVQNSKEDFNGFNFPKSDTSSLKRAHFQHRSNSVKEMAAEPGGPVVLKSALKKTNQSSETLSSGSRVMYNDQTFAEAAYPSLPRAAKSIPNISFHENVNRSDEMLDNKIYRERPLSRSSNTLDANPKHLGGQQELRPRSNLRGGPDVLVYYDTRPEDDEPDGSSLSKSKSGSLTKKLPGFLKMLGKEEKVAPPIIEMVPVTTPPSTYQFPSRPSSNYADPIYVQRPHFHRVPVPVGSTPCGITYPNYAPAVGGIYPALSSPSYLPMGGPPGTLSTPRVPGTPVLTTPRHPLSQYGSLQRAKVPPMDGVMSGSLPRPPLPGAAGEGCIYGYMVPPNRLPGHPPNLSRTSSVDQSGSRISFDQSDPRIPRLDQPGARVSFDQPPYLQSGNRNSSDIYGSRQDGDPGERRVSTIGYIRVPDHRSSLADESQSGQPNSSKPETVISSRAFSVDQPLIKPAENQPSTPVSEENKSSDNTSSEPKSLVKSDSVLQSKPDLVTQAVTTTSSVSVPAVASTAAATAGSGSPPSSPKTPVLRKIGEKTPPGTLRRDRPTSSCKSWYSQYSQAFLSKTIDTPIEDLPPLGDEDFVDEEDSSSTSSHQSKDSQK